MNGKVYDLAHELSRALKNTEEYRAYIEKRDIVLSDEKNKEILEDFKEKGIAYQLKQMEGKDISEDELKTLKLLEKTIMANPVISEYIQAEYKFSVLIQDINNIIGSDL